MLTVQNYYWRFEKTVLCALCEFKLCAIAMDCLDYLNTYTHIRTYARRHTVHTRVQFLLKQGLLKLCSLAGSKKVNNVPFNYIITSMYPLSPKINVKCTDVVNNHFDQIHDLLCKSGVSKFYKQVRY